jgi:Tfp pilus assembly protein PilO
MKKNLKTAPSRSWLFPVAVISGVAGYLFLVFLPGQRATAELREQFKQQQQYLLESTMLEPKIHQAESELAKTKRYRDAWHNSAPSEERVAHVHVDITEKANQSGAEIVRFEPQPAETSAYLRRLPLELALEGTFHQLFAFLAQLERLDAEFWIDSMHIESVPSTPGRLRCELRLALFAAERKISD